MTPEYGTLDRVLDHVKCDEILETLRHMVGKVLPEPGYRNNEMRSIVPEVGVWCLLDGLICVDGHGQDHRLKWYRLLTTTDKGKDVVWDLLHIIKEEGLGVNVCHAYKKEMKKVEDSWHMEGYTPVCMLVLGVYKESRNVLVQHPKSFDLYYASIEDIRFAKQTTLEVKSGIKSSVD